MLYFVGIRLAFDTFRRGKNFQNFQIFWSPQGLRSPHTKQPLAWFLVGTPFDGANFGRRILGFWCFLSWWRVTKSQERGFRFHFSEFFSSKRLFVNKVNSTIKHRKVVQTWKSSLPRRVPPMCYLLRKRGQNGTICYAVCAFLAFYLRISFFLVTLQPLTSKHAWKHGEYLGHETQIIDKQTLSLYTGWFVPKARYQGSRVASVIYLVMLRWIVPLAIVIIFVNNFI